MFDNKETKFQIGDLIKYKNDDNSLGIIVSEISDWFTFHVIKVKWLRPYCDISDANGHFYKKSFPPGTVLEMLVMVLKKA